MAVLYPFSSETERFLSMAPSEGETHRWLAQVTGRLRDSLTSERCEVFLRMCCKQMVRHREIPDKEIAAAVAFAYEGQRSTIGGKAAAIKPKSNYGERALNWPDANDEVAGRVLGECDPVFDGEIETGLGPGDVLPQLFNPGELVCTGRVCEKPVIRPVEAALSDAGEQQFIVINPMKGPHGINLQGRISPRCQDNILQRRYLVAEFDDPTLPKAGQAILASHLGGLAPLVMAVDSGGKSVHAWYRVDGMDVREQARFFAHACLLGADRTRWDVCGWLRMPGGLRVKNNKPGIRQRILYWSGKDNRPQTTV